MSSTSIVTALCFFFFFLLDLIIFVTGESPPPHVPPDNIALDCGSSFNASANDSRFWTADINSTLAILHENSPSINSTATESPTTAETVPYITARLSRSEFTYTFPLATTGPKFIRLHFYPTTYPGGFNLSNAFFSVTTGPYTFLSNFSAALHAEALGDKVYVREFCLNVQEKSLSITFTPSLHMVDPYAFINGIEIISMPTNLYYTAPNDRGVNFIGQNYMPLQTTTALELKYRINVAGNFIPPLEDTGMFRSWSNDDEKYLTDARPSVDQYNDSVQIRYNNDRTLYAAPKTLYRTARTMGNISAVNKNYNLTWEFPVDSAFIYLVRLHFCQFIPLITKPGDLTFTIYIANQTAEIAADIIEWSGGYAVPVYRDYAVTMEDKVQSLSIALHPYVGYTKYPDAMLNGVEIFKMSKLNSLAAPNPDVPLNVTPFHTPPSAKPKNNRTKILTIVGGAIGGMAVLSVLFFFVFRRRVLRVKDTGSEDAASKLRLSVSSSTKPSRTQRSSLPSDLCRHFSLAEMKAATNNFDDSFIIGVGGFGNVYKGLFDGGAVRVAIKRLNPSSQQGATEFKTEIEMLSQLRFRHLVSLIGYCNENHEKILVYDYMARGTLRDHLYNTDNPPLSWTQRLEICIGAARGLHYLHTGAKHTVIHRDVKTTNILLDEKWVAKVSDFGLSKSGPTSMSNGAYISTVVKGSVGYLDPEYCQRLQLTEKSDVYSFGVVLCEVLCARPAVNRTAAPASLAELARQSHRNGTFHEIIDPYLNGKISNDCLNKFIEVAVSCLHENGMKRPSMTDVVWGLEFSLQLQESAEEYVQLGEKEENMESPLKGSSIDDSSDLFSTRSEIAVNSRIYGITTTSSSGEQSFLSNNSEKMMSGAVFSEIMNPTAR